MSDAKPNILLLFPGPIYGLEALLGRRLMELSKFFEGTVVTISNEYNELDIGDFKVISVPLDNPVSPGPITKFRAFVDMYKKCKEILNSMKNRGKPIELIVSYDPLKIGLMGVALARKSGAKLAVEINGDFTEDAVYLDIKSPLKRKIKKASNLFYLSLVLKFATGARLLHEGQLGHLTGKVNCPVRRTFPDYVDLTNFAPAEQEKTVLLVGYPFMIKGVDILIASFKKIADKFPDWKLKILGWFPDEEQMQSHIDGHPQIFHHPPVLFEEMPGHMASAGLFVLSSRTEAMGRVLQEAAACRVPRLGSKVGGIPTVIEDGVDGLLFESENVDDLAQKLTLLLSDEALREKYAQAGFERAAKEFNGEVYFKNCTAFYNEVINYKE